MRNTAPLLALAALILAAPVLAAPALAVGPDAAASAPPAAAAPPAAPPGANLATAAKAVMNPADTVKAFNQSMRASEEQNKAAVAAMNQAESRPAPKAAAPRPGAGKVMYGDIIIHK